MDIYIAIVQAHIQTFILYRIANYLLIQDDERERDHTLLIETSNYLRSGLDIRSVSSHLIITIFLNFHTKYNKQFNFFKSQNYNKLKK